MNEALMPGLAVVAGLLLGAVFFGGLWWTVRKGVSSQRQALWFLGSFVLRSLVVVTRERGARASDPTRAVP